MGASFAVSAGTPSTFPDFPDAWLRKPSGCRTGPRYCCTISPKTLPRRPCGLIAERTTLLLGLRHMAQFLFQVADLIAQPRGKFELELFRGGVHLFAHLTDEIG